MTAVKAPVAYRSGLCVHGRHDHCKGAWGSAVCDCGCHQEPEPEPPGLRIGSLFSGYGGLEQGVQAMLGGTVAWHSEIDPGACKILAHRYPDVRNLGDITAVDWTAVEPVDVLCGGFPCQDVSAAGKRAGIRPGTRSGLWTQFAYAIDQLRPRLVVIENVRGLLSADAHHPAHGDMEPCPWCVGDDDPVLLRALGAVLGDLAELGFDAEWVGLRAADVGAPHGRFRVFVVAWPVTDAERDRRAGGAEADTSGRAHGSGPRPTTTRCGADAPADAHRLGHERGGRAWDGRPGPADSGGRTPAHPEGDGRHEGRPEPARIIGRPDAAECCATCRHPIEWHDAGGFCAGPSCDTNGCTDSDLGRPAADANGDARGAQPVAVTGCSDSTLAGHAGAATAPDADPGRRGPLVADLRAGEPDTGGSTPAYADGWGREGGQELDSAPEQDSADWDPCREHAHGHSGADWGPYGPAIRRWERRLGRSAPSPTEPGAKGQPRLSPAFVEWLMGLPAGWVTDVPGLTRNEQLKALGNGVVPQQAAEALPILLARTVLERAS